MFQKSTPRKVTITYVCAESSWNRVFPIAGWNCRESLIKKGPRNDQDNCSLSSAFISIGLPLYLSLSILQWKNIKVATRDIIPLRPSAFWSQLTSI